VTNSFVTNRNSESAALTAALQHALAWLDGLDQQPVNATADLATLRQRLSRALADDGVPADRVIADLVRNVEGGLLGSAGGRFFAWVIGGSLPSALAADWLTSAWDQNAALYACAPAASVVEEVAGAWLKEILGLPRTASFALVSGCQMAHVTCLAAARHALLSRRGWDVERKGLAGAPPIRILTSDAHGSITRAVRLLGVGSDHITFVEAHDFERALASAASAPTVVALQAGDINAGAYGFAGASGFKLHWPGSGSCKRPLEGSPKSGRRGVRSREQGCRLLSQL
jgi:glutamate/tyrosine decarboxylase-like PLP-dependent enzyme